MNIDLRAFNAIADGKYNAGEVVLGKGNTLCKINNHVTMGFLNNKKVDFETMLQTKQALLDAFRNEGLSDDSLERIRSQLGLPADGAEMTDIQKLNFKPLARREVRSLLDSYNYELAEKKMYSHPNCPEFRSTAFNKMTEKLEKEGADVQKLTEQFRKEAKGLSERAIAVNKATRAKRNAENIKFAVQVMGAHAGQGVEGPSNHRNRYAALYFLLKNPGTQKPEDVADAAVRFVDRKIKNALTEEDQAINGELVDFCKYIMTEEGKGEDYNSPKDLVALGMQWLANNSK